MNGNPLEWSTDPSQWSKPETTWNRVSPFMLLIIFFQNHHFPGL